MPIDPTTCEYSNNVDSPGSTAQDRPTWSSPRNWKEYCKFGAGLPTSAQQFGQYIGTRLQAIARDRDWLIGNESWGEKLIVLTLGYIVLIPIYMVIHVVTALAQLWPVPANCENPQLRQANWLLAVLTPMDKLLGVVPPSLMIALQYQVNYNCPTKIPSGGDINMARLRGWMDKDEWAMGHLLNGNCLEWQEMMLKASQTVFSIPEVMKLWNCGVISNDKLPQFLEQAGVQSNSVISGYKYIYEQIPSLAEVFESMRKNSEDTDVQDQLGLNADFEERYVGQLKTWGDRNGYTLDALKFMWRVQRPALDQRVILRMYRGGQMTESEMVSAFRYNGHAKVIAEKLAKAIVRVYAPVKAAAEGKLTVKEIDDAFIGRHINEQEYQRRLTDVGVPADELQDRTDSANFRRTQTYIKQKAAAVGRAFVAGRINDDEGKSLLIRAGMDPQTADDAIGSFRIARELSNKQVTVEKLCKWVGAGYIDMSEYLKRMGNLGYNATDAGLLTRHCADQVRTKAALDSERAAKKELSRAEKALRLEQKRQRDLRKLYRERFPCKSKPKPTCPPGVEPPPLEDAGTILNEI